MRIALIVPGGVDRTGRYRVIPVLLSLIERLARDHQVLVVAVEHEPEWCQYPLLGATVINLGRVDGAGRLIRWAVRLRRFLKALNSQSAECDLLHAFWVGTSASLAVAAGRLLRVPVMVSVGGGELVWLPDIAYGGQGSYLGRMKTSWALRMASAVSACSQYSLGPLAERRPDALWLPYGADRKVFDGPTERKPGPPWRLVHVASLNKVKDQGTLLRAVRLVHNQAPVELDFIGEDTLGGSVQRLAAELGLGPVVKFHGFKPVEELAPFYHQAHVYVHSSLFESMGAVVLEAAAAGLPTVGTSVGIIAEMAPEAAVAVPVGNPEALAQGILSLLADGQKRSSLARAAQQFARTYDADWTAAKCEELYARLSKRPLARDPPSQK
jgi:glycosyltransferase involved in cell wall biosynthesis